MTEPCDDTARRDSLRDQLMKTEPLDGERSKTLFKEISTMYCVKLTKMSRAWWIIGLCAAILFSICGTMTLMASQLDGTLAAIWWLYTLSNFAMVGFAGFVLSRGEFDYRWTITLGKASPAACMAIALMLIMQAVSEPTLPALAWSLFGLLMFVLAISITIYNRIVGSELANREQLLRVELRIAELTEKLSQNDRG